MKTKYISSSDLKNNISFVLHDAYHKDVVTIVEKYGKPIAKVIPYKSSEKNKKKDFNKYFGAIPDFPDVVKDRVSSKKIKSL